MNNLCRTKSRHGFLTNSLLLALFGTVHAEVQAALPADATLAFVPGVISCEGGFGTPPNNCYYGTNITTGSYFAMDANGNGVFDGIEKTSITRNEGVRLGELQPASGSHAGSPDGTELPSIDSPWAFFGNTGMHQTTSAVVIVNGDDGSGDSTASLDFSGWGVTWAGIPNIPLGGDSANFPSDTGVAIMTCSSDCGIGDSFSLDHLAHVPLGDPSGFGGVYYSVHLEGTIEASGPIPPTKSVSIQLTDGSSQECASHEGALVEVTANIITSDSSDVAAINWELDGADAGSGYTVNILTPLGEHTISLYVDTLASGSFQSSEPVVVLDHTPPDLDIRFIDQRSGVEVTEVAGDSKHYITVRYDVVDACDPSLVVSGVAVPVYTINDGDTIQIDKKALDTTTLGASAINVSADATDASGNQRHREATLKIVD